MKTLISRASWIMFFSLLACAPVHEGEKGSKLQDAAPPTTKGDFPTQLNQILQKGIDQHRYAGLSIVVLDNDAELFHAHYGYRDISQNMAPDDHTVYELGSISKVFTRLLLEMNSDISLSDPISEYLPSNIHAPKPAGKEIRIQDLALHTGFRFGIPCVPKAPDFKTLECYGVHYYDDPDLIDPYRDGTRDLLFQYVDAYSAMLGTAPGDQFPAPGLYYSYSNAGMGLLGELLALKHSATYADIVHDGILGPLGLQETYVAMPCEGTSSGPCANLAKVYRRSSDDSSWAESSLWHMPGLPGAGGLRSTLADMRVFLATEMGVNRTAPGNISSAIAAGKINLPGAEADLRSNLCKAGQDPKSVPCNLGVQPMYEGLPADPGRVTFFHAGETGSSESMIMMSQDGRFGLVILTNSIPGTNYRSPPHVPNDLGKCIFQLLGRPLSQRDACAQFN